MVHNLKFYMHTACALYACIFVCVIEHITNTLQIAASPKDGLCVPHHSSTPAVPCLLFCSYSHKGSAIVDKEISRNG